MKISLIEKYNVSVPRYTSYPTVPDWNNDSPDEQDWLHYIQESYHEEEGISLYIHLPFCESLCTYCGCNKRITTNHKVEVPYIRAILKEWSIYRRSFIKTPKIKQLHLGGGTPTFFSPENLSYLVKSILETCDVSQNHEFSFEAHPNSTTDKHLSTLHDLGFSRISIGVQDISDEILKAINRKQTISDVVRVTSSAKRIGYTSINYDIIYGLPFQRPINIKNTIDFIRTQQPDRIAFYSYAHIPWKSASQRAFTIKDVPMGDFKNDLHELGKMMLQDIGYEMIGMDHFCKKEEALFQAYKNGQMHRNFMGYTPTYSKTCIALGVSAIGDSSGMFVQNDKKVESYEAKIQEGHLPLIKGHILSLSERVMQKAILDLMCRNKISWTNDPTLKAILKPQLKNLIPLIEDGLVIVDNNGINVTTTGSFFIRNICAAIDPMFTSNEEVKKYSNAI